MLDPTKTTLSSFSLFLGLPFGENRDGFFKFYGAQELIPRTQFRQPM